MIWKNLPWNLAVWLIPVTLAALLLDIPLDWRFYIVIAVCMQFLRIADFVFPVTGGDKAMSDAVLNKGSKNGT